MRRNRTAQFSVALVCVILGALLMLHYRTQIRIGSAKFAESATDQTTIISNLYESNVGLRKEAEALLAQTTESERTLDDISITSIEQDLRRLRVFNASAPVTGPGISLRVSSDLQPEHVLDLINELRNAGAEAIALNDVRLGVDSTVASSRGLVLVDGNVIGSPLVFRAIGSPEALDRALGRKGGVVSYLRNAYTGTELVLSKHDALTLPARQAARDWRWAQQAD